jgi:phosphate transport system permease protein
LFSPTKYEFVLQQDLIIFSGGSMTHKTEILGTVKPESMETQSRPLNLRKRPRIGEMFIQAFLFFCGAVSILTTVGIVYELGKESLNLFTQQQWEDTNKTVSTAFTPEVSTFETETSGTRLEEGQIIRIGEESMLITTIDGTMVTVERGYQSTEPAAHRNGLAIQVALQVNLWEFFTGTEWVPQSGKFGIWPLLNATLMTTFFAMLIALPIGLSSAIYLSEYASDRARNTLKPTLEVLAGVPTVIYGFFALTFMTPLLRSIFGVETVEIYNTASAGLVIGILIIPLVTSMSEDALSAVPKALREASYGLGATKLETAVRVVLPAAVSGVVAAFIVAISRALGETMVVAIAAGAGPNFTFNPFEAAETITGHIVRISGGDLSYDSIDYNSIFSLALVLFLVTLVLNIISQQIVRRFREEYE